MRERKADRIGMGSARKRKSDTYQFAPRGSSFSLFRAFFREVADDHRLNKSHAELEQPEKRAGFEQGFILSHFIPPRPT